MIQIRTTVASVAAVAAVLIPLALGSTSAQAGTTPGGALVSARHALSAWACDPVADEKFSCNDASGAGFTVVLRPIASLPKWQDDPDLTPQIAVQRKTYFLTVQPNPTLSSAQFAAVKSAVAQGH